MARARENYPDPESILQILKSNRPNLEELAEILDLSKRSLQRSLERHGTRYSKLVDRGKFDVAKELLNNRNLNIADIGRVLGYRDPSSFSRAFLRWSGETPRSYRSRTGVNLK